MLGSCYPWTVFSLWKPAMITGVIHWILGCFTASKSVEVYFWVGWNSQVSPEGTHGPARVRWQILFFFLTCWFSMAVKSDLYWFMIYRWFSTSQSVELSEGSLFFSMRAEVLIWKAWRSSVHRIALTRLEGTGKIWKISVFVGIKGVFYMWSYQRLTLPTLTFGSILDVAIRFFFGCKMWRNPEPPGDWKSEASHCRRVFRQRWWIAYNFYIVVGSPTIHVWIKFLTINH